MTDYLGQAHPEIWNAESDPDLVSGENLMKFMMATMEWEAPDHALSLGITCEACHMGSKEHAVNPEIKPNFFPVSPHLHVEGSREVELGRTHQNVNWICGRCHAGHRPQLAAGMSTWNSTEYSDAMRGSCYTNALGSATVD